MTTVAIFGGGGFAGGAIRDELVRRGHSVISVTRSAAPAEGVAGVEMRQGSVHDPDLVEALAADADALVVAIPAREVDGASLSQAVPSLSRSAAAHGADWFVQSPAALFGSYAKVTPIGSYRTDGDVMVVNDNGESQISGEDFAVAFADELENPTHHGERYTVGQ